MEIYEQSIVILPSTKKCPNRNFEIVQNLFRDTEGRKPEFKYATFVWDVQNPQEEAVRLKDAISKNTALLIEMPNYNEKAIKDSCNIAARHGLKSHVISNEEVIEAAVLLKMPHDLTDVTCGLDFIGDLHGCREEYLELLEKLGYVKEGFLTEETRGDINYILEALQAHPEGRKSVLLGDLTDRGPYNLDCLLMARKMDDLGNYRVAGNHDEKAGRALSGAKLTVIADGLQGTLKEMEHLTPEDRMGLGKWLLSAEGHLIFDGGRVAAAHAGISEEYQGRHTGGARAFALYGKATSDGKVDAQGYPERQDWASDYKGETIVIHGHVVYPEVRELNNVIAIDTGCAFGGKLTAYKWPEREIVDVQAKTKHWDGG